MLNIEDIEDIANSTTFLYLKPGVVDGYEAVDVVPAPGGSWGTEFLGTHVITCYISGEHQHQAMVAADGTKLKELSVNGQWLGAARFPMQLQ